MKFTQALEYLGKGMAVIYDDDAEIFTISPEDPDETVLDISITQALSDKWELAYTNDDYKRDMGMLAETLARLTVAGFGLRCNGEELREIETLSPDIVKFKPGFVSNYNGKWTLK